MTLVHHLILLFQALFIKLCSPKRLQAKKAKVPANPIKQIPSCNEVAGSQLHVQPVVQRIVHHTPMSTVVTTVPTLPHWSARTRCLPPTAIGTLPYIKGNKLNYPYLTNTNCHNYNSNNNNSNNSNPATTIMTKVPLSRTNLPATKRFNNRNGWVWHRTNTWISSYTLYAIYRLWLWPWNMRSWRYHIYHCMYWI